MSFKLVLLIAATLCMSIQGMMSRPKLTKGLMLTMDADDKYNVSWEYTGTEPSDNIVFTVEVETTGWVGLGFSPNGAMTDADIIIGWVDSSGKGHITDRHAKSNSLPPLDDEKSPSGDVHLYDFKEADGKTMLKFSRRLGLCNENDYPLTTDTVRLIYAYGKDDPEDPELDGSFYHGVNRGSKSTYLFDPAPAVSAIPANSQSVDLKVSDYVIPNTDTTYHCSFHAVPQLTDKHHIVSAEVLVTPGNEGVVHHLVLFACWNVTQEHMRNANKTEGICSSPEMPEFMSSCQNVIFGWAVGGSKFYFPENAGYPLGTKDGLSPEYLLLQLHYDNPSLKQGIRDSSGVQLTYTPDLRANDVGSFTIGTVDSIFVPPQADEFRVVAYCHSDCTSQWIPHEGVNVFAYFLHAHLLGVGIKVEWYRDGKAVGIFANDDSYDFNYQENRLFRSSKKLMPGDSLKITCTMSSTRNRVTFGGEATSQEMCLAFFMYYPKRPISDCQSIPSYVAFEENVLYKYLPGEPGKTSEYQINWVQFINGTQWSEDNIEQAQKAVEETDHLMYCTKPGRMDYEEQFSLIDAKDYPPIQTPQTCAATSVSRLSLLVVLISLFAAS